MNDYYEVRVDINPCTEDTTDLLAAMLGDIGFESFVPDEQGLTAYVKAEDYDAEAVKEAIEGMPYALQHTVTAKFVEGQDWNAEWEKNYFKPIIVDDECVIHGSFHTDIPQVKYDIVIDPKMAFGTGHHATTSQIIAQLLKLDLEGKTVIDMGTGTGILAILCAMRGAKDVYGIEIDSFAYENALDNVKINNHPEIKIINGDASASADLPTADVFIANINRNVIVSDLKAYVERMHQGSVMLLSGFYEHDIPVIMDEACKYGLTEISHTTKGDNWCCLKLVKDPEPAPQQM